MATSRSNNGMTIIPAAPTSVGATDDAALGGIFSRSNLANPVSGADVNGVAINNATITLDINGVEQTFMLNQSTDQTLTYTVAGGTGTGVDPNAFTSASISGNVITLTTQGGTAVPITLPAQTGGGNPLTALTYDSATRTFTAALTTGSPIVSAPITGFVTGITQGGVALNENAAGVVDIPVSSSTVNIRPTGAAANNTDEFTVSTATTRIGSTDYHLAYDVSSNTLSFSSTAVTPPTPAAGATENFVAPSNNALSAPVAPTNTITPNTGTTVNSITSTITGNVGGNPVSVGSNPITIPPAVGGTTPAIDITFPDSTGTGGENYSNPGTYTVTTTTMAVNPDGNSNTITNTDTFTRFYPFFQFRTQPTDGTAIAAGTASTVMWNGRSSPNNNFTAIAGTGSLFIAAPAADLTGAYTVRLDNAATGFRLNNRLVSTSPISVTITGATPAQTVNYNVYQIAGVGATSNLFVIPS